MAQAQFGQFSPPNTGTATSPTNSDTYQRRMVIYPDPNIAVYVSSVAFSSSTAGNVAILRAGGSVMVLEGPIQPSGVFMLAASGAPVVTWTGQ